ncbi:ATP-independent RNA helicase DbpA [Marinagarivorans cellulosilyticus]|uniref:ATP-independent RNA helicase DbpA n=1 Tax=Marinagarivorans cellulosilyticus TaxID=2721545 RepID=A0AAN1WLB0_9GAMM|nr:ATP-independent RNA helicase DbpA [Marinagarivorans cellulosilyticus]
MSSFASLALKPELLSNLESLNYTEMTPIQAQSLPAILAGDDVIGEGKTGSGKTAAFGLGILQHLEVKRFRIQTLILCPTRELAEQVAAEVRKLARAIHNIKVLCICGGMPFGPQIGSLEHGAHIIVGTPGRIEEHLRKGSLVLNNVKNIVLDEADRMLDMGFQETLDTILGFAPKQRQTLLFSATFPKEIESIAKRVMRSPTRIRVESQHTSETITQHFYKIDELDGNGEQQRLQAIQRLLCDARPTSAVIFCNTKRETQAVADDLNALGFSATALHGDLEQRERDQALVRFSNKSVSILVATDVAARGLDIEALDAVINYQIARDSEVHTHRIGRTGRAGQKGVASTLFSGKENFKIERLKEAHNLTVDIQPLPPAKVLAAGTYKPAMKTLQIDGGKKQKVRAGDILGALTGKDGIDGKQVGKIQIMDNWAFVAVSAKVAKDALSKIANGKLKGRTFRVRLL